MIGRDSQTVTLSRQSILLVAGVGVGLLTLTYVLGVQIGKQAGNLRKTETRGPEENLSSLPEPLLDQLKHFEDLERRPDRPPKPEAPATAPKVEAETPPPPKPAPKPTEPKQVETAKPDTAGPRWTLQLVTTTDPTEIDRLAARAKAAGFATTVVKEKGTMKLRITQVGPREKIDAAAAKLKDAGFRPFAVKVE